MAICKDMLHVYPHVTWCIASDWQWKQCVLAETRLNDGVLVRDPRESESFLKSVKALQRKDWGGYHSSQPCLVHRITWCLGPSLRGSRHIGQETSKRPPWQPKNPCGFQQPLKEWNSHFHWLSGCHQGIHFPPSSQWLQGSWQSVSRIVWQGVVFSYNQTHVMLAIYWSLFPCLGLNR